MMTLANYGLKSSKHKDPNSAKSLSKSLQIRNRAELALKQCLRTHFRLPEDKRNDIISHLEEYYARVPFNVAIWNKFQSKQCIVDSILLLDSSFNPYKARQAFKVIEDMLINLIYLPWHKEFTKISTYSGRFRYIISNALIGAEEVFKAAGFEPSPNDSVINLVLPESGLPQNDEMQNVTSVIFDCMLAQVVLTDVICIFEGCCKSLKQAASELPDDDVNCYSWIQAYFRERSHQITDKARFCIQELLNNISNHLTKQRITAAKSSSSIKSSSGSAELPPMKKEIIDNHPDKVAAQQQQLRKYLNKKNLDDANALRLYDDLLKLPDSTSDHNVAPRKQYNTTSDESKNNTDLNYPPTSSRYQANSWRESNNQTSSAQYRHQPITRAGSRLSDTFDMIDSQIRPETSRTTSYDSMNQAVRADAPHNDREPLLPRPDRKFIAHDSAQTSQGSPHQYYRSSMSSYPDNIGAHTLGSAGRYQYDGHLMSSHDTQASSQQSQNMIKNSSSRYDCSSNRKYESRDTERAPFNSRLQWSCNSCTFNNQLTSEICEMCGKRRL